MKTGIRDIRMMSKALRKRWPISDCDKASIIKALVGVVNDPDSSERAIISATKGLLAAEEMNQRDEHHAAEIELKQQKQNRDAGPNRFLKIANELGIDLNGSQN